MAEDGFAAVAKTPAVQELRRRLEEGGVSSFALSQGAQPFLAALLRKLFPGRPIVVVTEGLKSQESFHQDLSTWIEVLAGGSRLDRTEAGRKGVEASRRLAEERVRFYPAWEVLPHEGRLPHVDVISERLETLLELCRAAETAREGAERCPPLVVTSVTALMQATYPADLLRARVRTVSRGDRLDPLDLIEWLEDQGYEPEAQVSQKGEIALRGGILDVFPPSSRWPVRLEFFGDELESLRQFDPITQISRETVESVTFSPAGEIGILKRLLQSDAASAAESSHDLPAPVRLATFVEHLPPGTLWLLCEPEELDRQATGYLERVPPGDPFLVPWPGACAAMSEAGMVRLELTETGESGVDGPAAEECADACVAPVPADTNAGAASATAAPSSPPRGAPPFQSLDAFRPITDRVPELQVAEAQRRQFFDQLHRWLRQGWSVHVFFNNEGERQRFGEIWAEHASGWAPPTAAGAGRVAARPEAHLGSLTRGFLCEEGRLVVVTDAEIFGRYKVQRPRRLKSPHAPTSRSLLEINFGELEEGDYVVHVQHGIGRYLGLEVLPPTSTHRQSAGSLRPSSPEAGQECLVLEYAPRDPGQPSPRLYVPVTEAHLVSKYVGAGKAHPPLNVLGGSRWAKTKAQAEDAVRDLAAELLAIQAAREALPGHAFAADTPWQREFESAFLYEETPDQMRSILQTKADMERSKPMDRLICGDVGYGKTEVAIRAAFKAVMGGKQVAVLVPTTILAQQHYNTFRERMADYPVRIELLSRFRSRREQGRVIRELGAGAIDLVIGTHRLVQNDIAFKDLGLVIIDEEQRFGVLHKEKFKHLRQMVDVLTLSATPIPRTLYLALSGARDMSTIETAPQDRLPVETIVTQYDERVIRSAIQRELARGGQVFYLHNRVHDIDAVASRLAALVPTARLVVGHGQMEDDELEEIMTRFVNGEADVLVSTTIIESGIDIPNANTIIIDRADRFGLSDLYQLRGRVGRYKHQAYAYLLIPRHAGLLSDARKRIGAIRQFSSLGSGFKIAMRDLEIRGAGNMLGPQQSGHVTAVGFELYCQLLKNSIGVLKGEKVRPRLQVQLRLDFLAFNPGDEGKVTRPRRPASGPRKAAEPEIHVPRETVCYATSEADPSPPPEEPAEPVAMAAAYIPLNYVVDPRLRVEIYRKVAEAVDEEGAEELKAQIRDRFGPTPSAVDLLLQVALLRIAAASRGITAIETEGDKLKLTRNGEWVMFNGKFPRLTRSSAKARLGEIRRLVNAL